jgi:hypothetical protein
MATVELRVPPCSGVAPMVTVFTAFDHLSTGISNGMVDTSLLD